ncbi:hypothetical protein IV203_010945 [Nitzschia inconspicua]|uniref:Protein kinase domain-containing protein n=1 Tax=Nitzschia inconspicua TaxID=303405 RepID=A0A9K3KYT7_9STRA|nr:hypothetical protein IV203_010945 [Nitzschia inconspicua]
MTSTTPISSDDGNSTSGTKRNFSTSSTSGIAKTSGKSSSNCPSQSASNRAGRDLANRKTRSVLCHPLGLPLLFSLEEMDTQNMTYLPQSRKQFNEDQSGTLDGLFQKAVEATKLNNEDNEKYFTGQLTALIEKQRPILSYGAMCEVLIKDGTTKRRKGLMDVILTQTEANDTTPPLSSPPLAVLEFGLNSDDWWRKFDQGSQYLDLMMLHCQTMFDSNIPKFHQPILLAVVTMNKNKEKLPEPPFQIGVFLFVPKDGESTNEFYRISLLWHSQTSDVSEASVLFGRFLRVTADFASWRGNHQSQRGYKYFSSHCCMVETRDNSGIEGAMVLRSYDNRIRMTDRNPEIYLNPVLSTVVGPVERVFGDENVYNMCGSDEPSSHGENETFWARSSQNILIIAVPYRQGNHYAKSPADFLPIINQLETLHRAGYVHGDIRSYNTVFKDHNEGWLIDFDFGGRIGEQKYPQGYKKALVDGRRLGKEGETITKYHDWFALGVLMFSIHNIPKNAQYDEMSRLEKDWTPLRESDCTKENIDALKVFLRQFLDKDTILQIDPPFLDDLQNGQEDHLTEKGATGSPLKEMPVVRVPGH